MVLNMDSKALLQMAILSLIEQENMSPKDVIELTKKETQRILIGLQQERQELN